METIKQRVTKIIAEHLGIDDSTIKMEDDFIKDLGADSLSSVEIILALEQEFNCEIPDDAAENIRSLQQAINYIESLQK